VAVSTPIAKMTQSPASAGSGAPRLVIAILPGSRRVFADRLALAALVKPPQSVSQNCAVDNVAFTPIQMSIDKIKQ
jgi:hypothetical protein